MQAGLKAGDQVASNTSRLRSDAGAGETGQLKRCPSDNFIKNRFTTVCSILIVLVQGDCDSHPADL